MMLLEQCRPLCGGRLSAAGFRRRFAKLAAAGSALLVEIEFEHRRDWTVRLSLSRRA